MQCDPEKSVHKFFHQTNTIKYILADDVYSIDSIAVLQWQAVPQQCMVTLKLGKTSQP